MEAFRLTRSRGPCYTWNFPDACRYRLGVRTRGSQPRDRGSIPVPVIPSLAEFSRSIVESGLQPCTTSMDRSLRSPPRCSGYRKRRQHSGVAHADDVRPRLTPRAPERGVMVSADLLDSLIQSPPQQRSQRHPVGIPDPSATSSTLAFVLQQMDSALDAQALDEGQRRGPDHVLHPSGERPLARPDGVCRLVDREPSRARRDRAHRSNRWTIGSECTRWSLSA